MSELFQCRTRLCGWCSAIEFEFRKNAGLFQCRTRLCGWCSTEKQTLSKRAHESFNAARGFVGGAASTVEDELYDLHGFNAARGFVGGAAPLHGRS